MSRQIRMKPYAVVLAGLLLSACAAQSPVAAPAPSGTVTVTPSTNSPESPMPSLSYSPKDSPQPVGPDITVTGTVEAGVERGCVMLRSGTLVFQLIGKDPLIVEGAKVTVTGRPEP